MLFWLHQWNANRNKCLASWSIITIAYCWLQHGTIIRLCNAYLKNLLSNIISLKTLCETKYHVGSRLFYFTILLEILSSYVRFNLWEFEAKSRRLNTPAKVSCLLILNINRMQIATSVRQIIIWCWRANIIWKTRKDFEQVFRMV